MTVDKSELWERRGEIFAKSMTEGAWIGQPKGDGLAVAQIGALAGAVLTEAEQNAAAANVRTLVDQVLAERAQKQPKTPVAEAARRVVPTNCACLTIGHGNSCKQCGSVGNDQM